MLLKQGNTQCAQRTSDSGLVPVEDLERAAVATQAALQQAQEYAAEKSMVEARLLLAEEQVCVGVLRL